MSYSSKNMKMGISNHFKLLGDYIIELAKIWRTIRIDDDIAISCEKFLKTEMGKKLGLKSPKEIIEYFTRKGIEMYLK
jgi:hypothetical protein